MKVALIYKKSAWELFSDSDDNNVSSFILEDGSQRDLLLESDLVQKQTIDLVERTLLGDDISYKKIYRSTIDEYDLNAFDLVITVGGDGTFLEASHHIKVNTPILGVNSDPNRSVGFFCACNAENFEHFFDSLSRQPKLQLNRLSLFINKSPIGPPVLNDVLFASPNPAATTRYQINNNSYRNSGLLISTGAGSTAWSFQEGIDPLPLETREFQLLHRGTRNTEAIITSEVIIHSLTRTGKIFIDGDHCTLSLSIGQQLEIKSGTPITVLGDINKKRAEFLDAYD
ncbi:MAG: NAD(+)/NADH kinase [Verrucomicrobiales bacterium]